MSASIVLFLYLARQRVILPYLLPQALEEAPGKGSGDRVPAKPRGQEGAVLAEEQPSRGSREGKVVTPYRPPYRGFFSSQVSLSRDKEAMCCIYPSRLGRVAEGRCFQILLLAGCLGWMQRCVGEEAGHRCSMMWLEVRRGFHPLSSTPCDLAGWS